MNGYGYSYAHPAYGNYGMSYGHYGAVTKQTLPPELKDIFLKLKRSGNSFLVGDTDDSIKEKTGIGAVTVTGTEAVHNEWEVITYLQTAVIDAVGRLGASDEIDVTLLTLGTYDKAFETLVKQYQEKYNETASSKIGTDGDLGRITMGTFLTPTPTKYKAPPRPPSAPSSSKKDSTKRDYSPATAGVFDLNPFFRVNNFWLYFSISMVGIATWALLSDGEKK